MRPTKMLNLCREANEILEEVEASLKYVPESAAFVYNSIRDVKELALIARYETAGRMTQEQQQHINQLIEKLHCLQSDTRIEDDEDDEDDEDC